MEAVSTGRHLGGLRGSDSYAGFSPGATLVPISRENRARDNARSGDPICCRQYLPPTGMGVQRAGLHPDLHAFLLDFTHLLFCGMPFSHPQQSFISISSFLFHSSLVSPAVDPEGFSRTIMTEANSDEAPGYAQLRSDCWIPFPFITDRVDARAHQFLSFALLGEVHPCLDCTLVLNRCLGI
jgi:hypothetical protein